MSRVLGIDLESSGLLVSEDRIIEIGAVIYDVEQKVPLKMLSHMVLPRGMVGFNADYVSPTGLKGSDVSEFGVSFERAMTELSEMILDHKPVALVGHNIVGFDMPLLTHEITRANITFPELFQIPMVDTRHDLPFEKEPSSRRLSHLISDHGFLNPYPHRAIFDVMACLKLLSCYDFETVLAQSRIPWKTVRAFVSYDDRQKAKDARFSWEEAGGVKYPKCWVKQIRENAVAKEIELGAAKGFKVEAI